ncbi:protein of unknown function [Legionella pneumophila subsp. pneumophila]|nr:protein of unknown function [Legionella pneumophila subsp. pneumophila]
MLNDSATHGNQGSPFYQAAWSKSHVNSIFRTIDHSIFCAGYHVMRRVVLVQFSTPYHVARDKNGKDKQLILYFYQSY